MTRLCPCCENATGAHQLTVAELAAARSVLRELIRLADQAPVLTEEQLRFRLRALAECALPRSHAHADPRRREKHADALEFVNRAQKTCLNSDR